MFLTRVLHLLQALHNPDYRDTERALVLGGDALELIKLFVSFVFVFTYMPTFSECQET